MSICYVEKGFNKTAAAMFVPHMHLWFELFVLAQGNRTVQIENERYELGDNSLLCIPPEHLHMTTGSNYSRYLVNFSKDYLDDFQLKIISLCQQQKISMSNEEASHIYKILDTMQSTQTNMANNFADTKSYAFKTCFSYLIFALTQLENFPSKQYVPLNNYNFRTRQIIAYLNEHYPEKITLEDISNIFHVSTRAICADFKKNTDMTIADYLLKIRLDAAKKLLSFADKRKTSLIAEKCGFSSQNYFSLIFKKKVHMSPNEYRKQVVNLFSKQSTPPPEKK